MDHNKHPDRDTKLTRKELGKLNRALDELMDAVSENHLPFLGTDGERLGLIHAAWQGVGKEMRRPRTCVFPGCIELSVPASHTLQKGGPLRFIAEDSHVCTPAFAHDTTGYLMAQVGIRTASTFPGFCRQHEALFHDFETSGLVETDRDVRLQVFRTICREVAVKRIHVKHLRTARETHNRLVSKNGMKFLKERLGTEFVTKHKLENLTLKRASKAERGILECEQEVQSVLDYLENQFLLASVEELNGRDNALSHVAISVKSTLPVCLAGLADFNVNDHGQEVNVPVILNVIPSSDKTLVLASTLGVHQLHLNTYMAHMLEGANGLLVAIETWMVRGTDHWFITPSEWERIPQARKAQILKDMLDESFCIGYKYPYSLIDSVRERMLALPWPKELPPEMFEAEASKLADPLQEA
jgi:hypothetical protein